MLIVNKRRYIRVAYTELSSLGCLVRVVGLNFLPWLSGPYLLLTQSRLISYAAVLMSIARLVRFVWAPNPKTF